MFKVLLVDDERYVRLGMRSLIDWHANGFRIEGEADTGAAAYAWIMAHRPDLVITDIRMPVYDGLELIRKVLEANLEAVSFILLSGYEDFKYAQQAIRYGAHDYMLKPVDEGDLLASLRKFKERRQAAAMEREDAHADADEARGAIRQIKDYVERHYRENISLRSLSRRFYLNPAYIGQLFRRAYGMYFNEYVMELRIREAKRLLRQSDLLIYQVAERVGFNSPDYFAKQFEKLERMKPSEYRNRPFAKPERKGGANGETVSQ